MKHGTIVSKPFAAEWAKENWSHWTALIERAWAGRQNPGLEAQPEDINGTLELIRYTLEYSRQIEKPVAEIQDTHSSSK